MSACLACGEPSGSRHLYADCGQAEVYTDTEHKVLLTIWPDGTHEVAFRDEHRRWLPPVRLLPEPKTPTELVEQSQASAEAERRARLDAGLARWSR